jgi:hypothetical protein
VKWAMIYYQAEFRDHKTGLIAGTSKRFNALLELPYCGREVDLPGVGKLTLISRRDQTRLEDLGNGETLMVYTYDCQPYEP